MDVDDPIKLYDRVVAERYLPRIGKPGEVLDAPVYGMVVGFSKHNTMIYVLRDGDTKWASYPKGDWRRVEKIEALKAQYRVEE